VWEDGIYMDEKIRKALKSAFDGEAKAALRLKVYAEKADSEGYIQIAKLFRAVAASEGIHGTRALKTLREIGSTEDNLAASFESEENVAKAAYNRFIKEATEAGDKEAALFFTQSRDVEETHAKLYKDALSSMASDRGIDYFICGVCGYVAQENIPDECPVCRARKDRFFPYGEVCR